LLESGIKRFPNCFLESIIAFWKAESESIIAFCKAESGAFWQALSGKRKAALSGKHFLESGKRFLASAFINHFEAQSAFWKS
jgi:hypothetical protein